MIREDLSPGRMVVRYVHLCVHHDYEAKRKIFMVLDSLRLHHAKPVKAWFVKHQDEVEVFYLPSFSPELNPDEMLNA